MEFVALVAALVFGPYLFWRWRRRRRLSERANLAASRGWQFTESDDSLLTRWRGDPFDLSGDKRKTIGVISGLVQGIPFTAFDYRRRKTRVINAPDEYETLTVWALHLPEPLPEVYMTVEFIGARRVAERLGAAPRVPTGDAAFDRHHAVMGAPAAVRTLFTPEVTGWMIEHRLDNVRIEGQDLLHVRGEQLRRTKPAALVATAERLADLVALFLAVARQPGDNHGA